MACRAVESWTLTSLVGASLDLALAYLFLVGATVAYFTSKLLSKFGLSLPCTCAQTSILFDFAMHSSLRSRFPFDSFIHVGASSSPRCFRGDFDLMDTSDIAPEVHLSQPSPAESISDAEKPSLFSTERVFGGTCYSDEEENSVLREDPVDRENINSCNDEKNLEMIRILQRELEEERIACVSLSLELDKERSAAASAAEETMAMISRLQKDKAEMDMVARQYQRMVEEKFHYDEDEMKILKETIVRLEREKHALEKKVEMYKKMLNSEELFDQTLDKCENFFDDKFKTLTDYTDDPLLMLQQIYQSFKKKEEPKDFGMKSLPIWNAHIASSSHVYPIQNFVGVRNHDEVFNCADDCDEVKEKRMLTAHSNACSSNNQFANITDDSVLNCMNVPFEVKDIAEFTVKDQDESCALIEKQAFVENLCRMGCDCTDQRCNEPSQVEIETSIHDVHAINNVHIEGEYKG